MYPDLKNFQNLHRDEICRQLKNDGYEILRRGGLCSVYHQPGSDFTVHVSMTPHTAALACDMFQKHADNPYLPKTHDHLTVNDRVHVSIIEKLVSLEELAEEDEEHVTFGIARALSSFAYGDEIHEPVHEELAKDPRIVEAVRALVGCARKALRTYGGEGDSLFVDRDVGGILFRMDDKGGAQPVFANALCYTTPSRKLEDEFNSILSRMHALENQQRKTPAACRGSPVP